MSFEGEESNLALEAKFAWVIPITFFPTFGHQIGLYSKPKILSS